MRLLLDTHVFLWWREDNPRLKEAARREISSSEKVVVSAASAWEVAIKVGLGKLRLPTSFEDGVEESGFGQLGIEFRHAAAVGDLPPHHGDPFDRMLIAQAQVEGLTVVTHDPRFKPYGVPVIWT